MEAHALSDPLDVVQKLFERLPSTDVRQSNWGVAKHFDSLIASCWQQIPNLNFSTFQSLKDGSLVRYRGMVQDMFDTEYFLGVYEEVEESNGQKRLRSGKYRDSIPDNPGHRVDFHAASSVTMDRLPLLCVPIPGEAVWCASNFGPDLVPSSAAAAGDDARGAAAKRKERDEAASNGHSSSPASRPKADAPSGAAATASPGAPAATDATHFPLPDSRNQLACLVKVYDEAQEGQFKLNDTVEFVGILSTAPHLASFPSDNGMDVEAHGAVFDSFSDGQSPPSSVVPRLHCITYRKLSPLDLVVAAQSKAADSASLRNAVSIEAPVMRHRLLAQLGRLLGGDALAAEYLLLSLMARVYKRHQLMCMGKLSLNITNCPDDAQLNLGESVRVVLHSLLAKLVVLPLSLDNLCRLRFTPRKDYDSNTLHSGLLQLSDGTYLAIDETALQPGQIDQAGMAHLNVITQLIMWQKVEYDFQYHQIEFEVDMPVLVLSHGKSMFACDCVLPLRPEAPLPSHAAVLLTPPSEFLPQLRTFIALSRSLDVAIDEATAKQMQEDFVRLRRDNPKVNQDCFQLWLSLARLQALSFGEQSLTVPRWNYMLSREMERLSRLP